ncbi:MAG: hypothetical protein PHW74_06060 [Desulfobacca sp.]|nr:hypothetical protein [Desulfobacca sp.]
MQAVANLEIREAENPVIASKAAQQKPDNSAKTGNGQADQLRTAWLAKVQAAANENADWECIILIRRATEVRGYEWPKETQISLKIELPNESAIYGSGNLAIGALNEESAIYLTKNVQMLHCWGGADPREPAYYRSGPGSTPKPTVKRFDYPKYQGGFEEYVENLRTSTETIKNPDRKG